MLIFGLVALVAALWVLNIVSKANPRVGARVLKASGGLLALGVAVFLGLRGQVGIAIPVGIFGLGLLGWMPFGPAGFSERTAKSTGQVSRVRTAWIEMALDHDSGEMRGHVLAGRHRGAELESLDVMALVDLLSEADDETRALLMPYLDRRDAGWREYAQVTRHRGGRRRPAAKCRNRRPIRSLAWKPARAPTTSGVLIAR